MAKRKRWDGMERRAQSTVLVAGDVADANELLSRILAAEGYRTVVADSVESGLARTVEQMPRVAVIDLSTRGIGSSLQLLDAIRSHEDERVARTRVIVVARSRSNRTFSFQSGADGFLLRPFHADELVAAIEEVVGVPSDELPVFRRDQLKGEG